MREWCEAEGSQVIEGLQAIVRVCALLCELSATGRFEQRDKKRGWELEHTRRGWS